MRNKTNYKNNALNQSLQFEVLNTTQCEKILDTAFTILSDVGCLVKNAKAREILKKAGCSVEANLVKIPSSLTKSCLTTVPAELTIYDQMGNPALFIGSRTGNSYFLPGMCTIYRHDLENAERRLATQRDVFETGLLVESLPNIDMASGLALISDCNQYLSGAYETRQLLEATTKPMILMSTSMLEIETEINLCAEVAGGLDKLVEKPFVMGGASATSPLTHDDENLETLMYMFEIGIPTPYMVSPMIGATAPVTLAGAIAVGLADNFVGMVLSQLINEGCPFIGTCFVDYMDLQSSSFAMSCPEFALGSAAAVDIFRYLNIPCVSHFGCTDSPVFDQQAALDISSHLYTAMLSGSNINLFSGFVETAMTGSLEALMFANDSISYLNRFIQGIEVSDETLALDEIIEVGPGGTFLGQEHTVEHYKENWIPDGVLERKKYAQWKDQGEKDYKVRANEKIRQVIAKGVKHPLDLNLLSKLDEILAEAEVKFAAQN